MSRNLVIISIAFSLILIVVSYFFVSKGENPKVALMSYSNSDKEKPSAKVNFLNADMGTVKVSEQKSTDFEVKNIGKKPLQLYNISSSCGCTVGKIIYNGEESPEFGMHSNSSYIAEIAPGKAAKVRVTYRPYVMPVYGIVTREVYITTNDPEHSKLSFKVKANVK